MTIEPIVAWYDLWIGAYLDRKGRALYILPIPCVGIVVRFSAEEARAWRRGVVLGRRWVEAKRPS